MQTNSKMRPSILRRFQHIFSDLFIHRNVLISFLSNHILGARVPTGGSVRINRHDYFKQNYYDLEDIPLGLYLRGCFFQV